MHLTRNISEKSITYRPQIRVPLHYKSVFFYPCLILFYDKPLGASFFLTKHFIHQYCPIKRGFLRDKLKWTEISRPKGSLIELTSSSKVAFCIWKGVTHLAKMQVMSFISSHEDGTLRDVLRERFETRAFSAWRTREKMYRLTSFVR